MGTLWTNVCTCLSTKMHCTIDSLHYLRKFMDNFESLSSWLHRLEDIVRRDFTRVVQRNKDQRLRYSFVFL
jgi:hypothetical protein